MHGIKHWYKIALVGQGLPTIYFLTKKCGNPERVIFCIRNIVENNKES